MGIEKWVNAKTLEESEGYHKRYNYAITNSIRRKILRFIDEGKTERELMEELVLSEAQLKHHLKMLEWGFCIEQKDGRWVVTEEGKIVDKIKG